LSSTEETVSITGWSVVKRRNHCAAPAVLQRSTRESPGVATPGLWREMSMMQQSGNKLVLLMCALAAVAAAVGWWSRYASTHLAADFWGPETAALLQGPSQVELLKFDIAENDLVAEQLAGRRIVSRHDISQAKGLTHLRSALVEDRNFVWDKKPGGCKFSKPGGCNPWAWGFRFHSENASTTVLLSSDFSKLAKLHADSKTMTVISCPALVQPLTTYFRSLEKEFFVGSNEP